MLKGYFDDSGKWLDPTETVVVVAGAIADLDQWESFDAKWKLVLKEFKVSEIHMKHFAHSRGEFRRWDEPKRQDFIGQLLRLAETHIRRPIGALLSKDKWENCRMNLDRNGLATLIFCVFGGH